MRKSAADILKIEKAPGSQLLRLLLAFILSFCLAGSIGYTGISDFDRLAASSASSADLSATRSASVAYADTTSASSAVSTSQAGTATGQADSSLGSISLDSIPAYSGSPAVAVNNDQPAFTDAQLSSTTGESYAALDSLGRATYACARVGTDTMPTEKRGSIGMVRPTGWHLVKYDFVDGKYLYNRCHLIGYQLTGENANTSNLITGTRYLNVQGMLPYENKIDDYVDATGNHVLYRVTAIYDGSNLLASGVHMEAESVEDGGAGVKFNVYAYDVQPGVSIDYATGESTQGTTAAEPTVDTTQYAYILNTNSKVIHRPGCSSVAQMSDKNKQGFNGTLAQAQAQGYKPCSRCNPT